MYPNPYNGTCNQGPNYNPAGQFTGMSYNSSQYNTQQRGYQFNPPPQPTPLLDKINYTQPIKNIIHDNINDNLLDETIVEYKIVIDSSDRDIKTYPNPFDFIVNFGGSQIDRVTYKDQTGRTRTQLMYGTPLPIINKDFRNVKYITLDSIVLPQAIVQECKKCHECDSLECEHRVSRYNLVNDRFVLLVIDELVDNDRIIYSTSDNTNRYAMNKCAKDVFPITYPKVFGYIFPDTVLGNVYYSGKVRDVRRTFKQNHLAQIKKLTIKICKSDGQVLNYNNMYTYDECVEKNISIEDPLHPLHPEHQIHLVFTIGVIESQLNQLVKFER